MIVFELGCACGHRFEAWFRDGAAYDQQNAGGEIECPLCGDRAITKAPMAPNIARSSRHGRESSHERDSESSHGSESEVSHVSEREASPDSENALPATADRGHQVRKMLERLRRHVETTCDYVGAGFPEEARRIHYGESDARGIYGEADRKEARELRDEGIDVCPIPWVPRRND